MKRANLTNGLLAIIAFCLVMNLAIQLNFIPTANATPPRILDDVKVTGIELLKEVPEGEEIKTAAIPVYILPTPQ